MSPEERQLLQGLFDRMRNQASNPRDREAEQVITDAIRQQPYAPYLLAQTVIVQDQALQGANQRLQQLEQQVQDLQRNAPAQPQSGGFLSGLFGGGARQPEPPPSRPVWNQGPAAQPGYGAAPAYAPPQAGGWGGANTASNMGGAPMSAPGGGGGGFLKGALGAAAGVAGGVLLADSIKGLIGGHGSPLGIGAGVPGAGDTVINNYYEGDGGPGGDGFAGGTDAGWDPGPGSSDAGWDPGPGATDAGWDPGSGGDAGWDPGSGNDDSFNI